MSSAGRRERDLKTSAGSASQHTLWGSDGHITEAETFDKKVIATGTQVTESESHRYDPKHGRYDGGGPFYTAKKETDVGNASCVLARSLSSNRWRIYSGPIWAAPPTSTEVIEASGSGYSSFRSEDTSDLDADGATAISLVAPVNPVSTLGTGLSESMREGIPTLPGIKTWRNRTNIARAAGDEYLNQVFGWLPLASEVNNVVNAARFHRDILNQYHRDEGRNVRREFEFPISSSTHYYETPGENHSPRINNSTTGLSNPATGLYAVNVGHWKRSITVERQVRKWFSGSFTYGLPSSTDSWGRALGYGSDADKLYGIALTPDLLWELTPWSWAIDWFSNTGRVIQNVTNFELAGLVMRYGYMMEESIEKVTAHETLVAGSAGEYPNQSKYQTAIVPSALSSTVLTRTKVRRPANPFGFGVGWEGLSPTQLLITAALGITRVL